MWVPLGVGSGPARVTLSYPDLEDWNIHPATVEVRVEEARWLGWLLHYGPWGLGAMLALGVAWFIIRRKARRAT